MELKRCKTCGGELERIENHYICEYCGNKWKIDSADDVHAVDRANAWSALRDGDFEKASMLFENIISKEPKNSEAYWGLALSTSGIVYVTDMNENKKVPTCNNITEESFLNNKNVQKAISLAPEEISESYKEQSEYIEKVRIEWLEKARKEPAYDVFLSFKDSDRENGIERTQDSIDAQDLYNALTAEGYKVFFSRISLRDKISEQYEPYIYNAIKTAKVMIVFGEKAEYFSSVWIKNEWTRFKTRIEKGEKHKNSLVVVYKNMNPGDLPAVLKSRQCLNASDITFLSDLTRHIKRVIEESRKNVHLEKITIEGGQISKKATTLSVNSVQTREIGAGAIAETSISEKQSISLIQTFLEEKQWKSALSLIDDVTFNNPACAEAIWCRILVSHRCASNVELIENIDGLYPDDFVYIEKILNCASKEYAEEIMVMLYGSVNNAKDETYKKILETILPYAFANRQSNIDSAFKEVVEKSKYKSFELLLTTLKSDEIDKYIKYNHSYAKKTANNDEKLKCLSNVLEVDEGNVEALREMVRLDLVTSESEDKTIKDFETLLKYTADINEEVTNCLEFLLCGNTDCNFAKQLIRYYKGDISNLKDELVKLSFKIIENEQFKEAEYFLNLILSFDPNNADVYWGICLMKAKAKTESDIKNSDIPISEIPEFNKYLALVDNERRKQCIALSKEQAEEELQKRITYNKAIKMLKEADHKEDYKAKVSSCREAANVFHDIPAYKDSKVLAEKCQEKERIFNRINELQKKANSISLTPDSTPATASTGLAILLLFVGFIGGELGIILWLCNITKIWIAIICGVIYAFLVIAIVNKIMVVTEKTRKRKILGPQIEEKEKIEQEIAELKEKLKKLQETIKFV